MSFRRKHIIIISLTVLVAGLLLVLAFVAYRVLSLRKSEHQAAGAWRSSVPSDIKDYAAAQLPPDLPQDFVAEPDAKVLHSYRATTPQGRLQETVVYATKQTPVIVVADTKKAVQAQSSAGWNLAPAPQESASFPPIIADVNASFAAANAGRDEQLSVLAVIDAHLGQSIVTVSLIKNQ